MDAFFSYFPLSFLLDREKKLLDLNSFRKEKEMHIQMYEYDAYIIKKEYGAGSENRTRNPMVMSLVSYQTVLSC